MDFRFRCAEKLYRDGIHPRVLLGPDDLAALRVRVRSGLGRRLLVGLRRKVRPLVGRTLECDSLPEMIANWCVTWNQPGTNVMFGLHDMAMVAALDGDAEALEAVRRVLGVLPEAERIGRGGRYRMGFGMPLMLPLAYDLACNDLTGPERRRFVRWAAARSVRANLKQLRPSFYKSAGQNIAMHGMMLASLSLLSIAGDDGAGDLSGPRRELASMFEAAVRTASGPDGYPEEDVGYGTAVVPMLYEVAEALCRAGAFDAFAQCPRLLRFGRAMLHFLQPWGGHLSNTGDHGDEMQRREFILPRLASRTGDPTLLWLMGRLSFSRGSVAPKLKMPDFDREATFSGRLHMPINAKALLVLDDLARPVHPGRATPPVPTAFRERSRGIVSFRSGWGADETLLIFDGSQRRPGTAGHYHASCGHFSLSALGEYFAIDSGRYCNDQDQHNVMLVSGRSGRDVDPGQWVQAMHHGRLTDYLPGEFCDAASVDSSHQHNCYWAYRTVGLVKGSGAPAYAWTVDDVNENNDFGRYWWALNTSPENTIRTAKTKATITGWRHGNHLDVHFALPGPKRYPRPHTLTLGQDVHTHSSPNYIKNTAERAAEFDRPSDMVHGPAYVRPRLLAKMTGYNGRLMGVLIPRRRGERAARVRQVPSLDATLAVRVTFEKVQDTLIWSFQHEMLEADGVVARGQWVVVRRSRRTGRVLNWQLGHGTSLVVDGKALRL